MVYSRATTSAIADRCGLAAGLDFDDILVWAAALVLMSLVLNLEDHRVLASLWAGKFGQGWSQSALSLSRGTFLRFRPSHEECHEPSSPILDRGENLPTSLWRSTRSETTEATPSSRKAAPAGTIPGFPHALYLGNSGCSIAPCHAAPSSTRPHFPSNCDRALQVVPGVTVGVTQEKRPLHRGDYSVVVSRDSSNRQPPNSPTTIQKSTTPSGPNRSLDFTID